MNHGTLLHLPFVLFSDSLFVGTLGCYLGEMGKMGKMGEMGEMDKMGKMAK